MPEPQDVALAPGLGEALPGWVSRQRWYAGKGRLPQLRAIGALRLHHPERGVDVETLLLRDDGADLPTTYQVPLTHRAAPLPGLELALVATTTQPGGGPRYVYDGTHDPAFTTALLTLVLTEGEARADVTGGTVARGHRQPGVRVGTPRSARVLTGEQSNTSIIYSMAGDDDGTAKPLICKVFRVLHHGDNPDVTIQSVLAAAGSRLVPQPVGFLTGQWPDETQHLGRARGHLAFVQEFLPGVEDAWRVALAAVGDGRDFSDRARSLGAATAQVHASLAAQLPTTPASPDAVAAAVASMRGRLAAAVSEVPALAEHEAAAGALLDEASTARWPDLQRIHGDYHLGQVLDVPGRGWVLLDFEGEPLRPLAERSCPDLALRDVAGMLRSFDYAAGSQEHSHPGTSAAAWAGAARSAFLDGYTLAGGQDPRRQGVLLAALELDKALYEVVYEARNRPDWLSIPTTAIARLVAGRRSTS